MDKHNSLKAEIETLRDELNQSIAEGKFEVYYEKSVALDKLIEKYIDLEEEIPA